MTQLTVNIRGSGNKLYFTLPAAEELGITETEERAAAVAFIGSASDSACNDPTLTPEQRQAFQLEPETQNKQEEDAFHVGEKSKIWGDELDKIRREIREDPQVLSWSSVEETDSGVATDTALEKFKKIVSVVLECDQDGKPTVMSPGRVEVLFILGYELCAAFIKKHALHLFMRFMNRVVGYLIKFLAASGFFPWLNSLGGWSYLHALVTQAQRNKYLAGLMHGLVIGISVVCVALLLKQRYGST